MSDGLGSSLGVESKDLRRGMGCLAMESVSEVNTFYRRGTFLFFKSSEHMWTQGKTWIDRRKRHKQHKWIFPSLSTFIYIVLNHIVSTQATMWDGYHFSSNLSRFWRFWGTSLNDTEGLVRSWNVLIPQHLWNPHVTQGRYLFGDITSWCCSGLEWCNGM